MRVADDTFYRNPKCEWVKMKMSFDWVLISISSLPIDGHSGPKQHYNFSEIFQAKNNLLVEKIFQEKIFIRT